jgi:hypothetical protein
MKTPKSSLHRTASKNNPLSKNKIQQYFVSSQNGTNTSNSIGMNQQQTEIVAKMQDSGTPIEERWKLLMENLFLVSNTTTSIKNTVSEHENRLAEHESRINELEESEDNNKTLLNDLAQANYNKMLEITGIVVPSVCKENFDELRVFVFEYLRKSGFMFNENNITSIYCFVRKFKDVESFVVRMKFVDEYFKIALMKQKKNRPPVYFSNVLTRQHREALNEARKKVKSGVIKEAWNSNGNVFIRLCAGGKKIKISDRAQLEFVTMNSEQQQQILNSNATLSQPHTNGTSFNPNNQNALTSIQTGFQSLVPENIRYSATPGSSPSNAMQTNDNHDCETNAETHIASKSNRV